MMSDVKAKRPHLHCTVCKLEKPALDCVRLDALRPQLGQLAFDQQPSFGDVAQWVCKPCLISLRSDQMRTRLEHDRGELSEIEANVSRMAAENVAISTHIEDRFRQELTVGQHVADAVARVGGSWPFVIGFLSVLVVWILSNTLLLRASAFDPYPYILLNLVLSCVAAIQAPIIMMSQNRSASRDRLQANEDFKLNLKAELEVAALHEKIDHLLHGQYARLMEAQELQLELLQELANRAPSEDE